VIVRHRNKAIKEIGGAYPEIPLPVAKYGFFTLKGAHGFFMYNPAPIQREIERR
jgi:hypothetical protein